jgi:16S rRNA (cytosine1402-N4)-methyltransferase
MTEARHLPVLLEEVLQHLEPQRTQGRPSCWLDGTLGLAGHAKAVLDAAGEKARLLGCDRDPSALALAEQALAPYGTRVRLLHGTSDSVVDGARAFLAETGAAGFDGILLDLGVSSMQLDQAERGFSFMRPGPLDMRMDNVNGLSVADWLKQTDQEELSKVLYEYGEEREGRRMAREVLKARDAGLLTDTASLAKVAEHVLGRARPGQLHPATRLFQALRIAVNDELGVLERSLPRLAGLLAPGGRFAVISFHSLEDRLVKDYFKRESRDCICPPGLPECRCGHKASLKAPAYGKQPFMAGEEELAENPRARSAKLRVMEKI